MVSFPGAANNLSGRRWPGSCASIGRLQLSVEILVPRLEARRGRVMFSGAASSALCGPRVKMCQNSSSRSRRRRQKAVRRPYKLTGRPGEGTDSK